MKCKNCKHWNKTRATRWLTDNRPDNGKWGSCSRIKTGYGWESEENGDVIHEDGIIPVNEAIVEEDEGWGMFTGEDFGCVLFETKDKLEGL